MNATKQAGEVKESKRRKPQLLEKVEQLYYPVRQEKLITVSGIKTSAVAMIREDNNEVIGFASDQYKVIPNEKAYKPLLEALAVSKEKWVVRGVEITRGGGRSFLTVDFPNITQQVSKKRGDLVALRGTFVNSYDRSCMFHVRFGAVRLVCTNGMTSNVAMGRVSQRHMGDVNGVYKQVQNLGELAEGFAARAKAWAALDAIKVEKEAGRKEIETLGKEFGLRDKWIEQAVNKWEAQYDSTMIPASQWGLYNAFTEVLTHQVANPEQRQKWGQVVTNHFEGRS
jgi:hypothetical protein